MPDASNQPPHSRVPPPFQFSLRWLVVVVTVVAIVLALLVSMSDVIAMIAASLVLCAVPAALVILVIYSRDERRTFSIGALIPWITIWLNADQFSGGIFAAFLAVWLLVAGAVCGTVALVTRRWVERQGNDTWSE